MDLPARYSAYKMSIFQGKVLLVKKLEIEKTKPTFTLKTLKVVYLVGLIFSNSNFCINKSSQGRKSVCEFSFSTQHSPQLRRGPK